MADQISGTTEVGGGQAPVDPWVAAFASLEQEGEDGAEGTPDAGGDGGDGPDNGAEGAGEGQVPDNDETGDSAQDEVSDGGPGPDAGGDDTQGGKAFGSLSDISEESIQKYEQELNDSIRQQAIEDIAKEFVKRGIRNRNGVLGATLDDADICKRDDDGVPHFYNPETGQEFRGDNPRRQAQEWIDDYNKELARVFNNACKSYEDHLKEEARPGLEVMRFAPKYDKLDDIRRGMLDNILEDYEVTDDSGQVIGYSCDLDKALALVDRQIAMIQNYAKQHQPQQQAPASGPVLDMKTSSGAIPSGTQSAPGSLAEAMERLQDEQLSKLKRN